MNLGLNLFSIRNLIGTEEDFLKTALALKENGYSYMQYSGAPYDADRIARVVKASGMPVYLTHVPYDRIVGDTDALMEEHTRFGCHNIGLGMLPKECFVDEDVCKQKLEELDRAGEYMAKNGFHFYYHHHFHEFVQFHGETVFDYMIKNAPHVNFTVDTYWLQYGGVDILQFLDKLKGRIGCVHLKDYRVTVTRDEKGEVQSKVGFAPLGDGTLDFPRIVKKMKELETQYYFVEQDDAADLPDTLNQVIRSVNYAKKELKI
jgi:sugar phosphate isomerase/epimerase